ncbi:MAG TPA: AAA family ATPase [Acidobacteriaceae bacterium]|jgi:predicted kinase
MRSCPQDPVFHAEGDVWTHVRMVCEALAGLPEWRLLPVQEREILFAAALLHDQAKPSCTREEAGRITSRGHSARGAIDARRILWEMDTDFTAREQVCALIRFHQSPFHLLNREDSQRQAFLISQTARCDLLGILARADILGRVCDDKQQLLDRVALFEEYCREQDCFDKPRQFPSAHSRFEYFRTAGRDPNYLAHEEPRCEAVIMSGLPGSGKDTWIENWLPDRPVVSLDAVRRELGESSTGNQGRVVQLARERAREFLRQKQDFVWNATNLSREIRGQLVDLFTDYNARVRVVYLDVPVTTLHRQNQNRSDVVPGKAIAAMMDRWEVPAPFEADQVEWWVDGQLLP